MNRWTWSYSCFDFLFRFFLSLIEWLFHWFEYFFIVIFYYYDFTFALSRTVSTKLQIERYNYLNGINFDKWEDNFFICSSGLFKSIGAVCFSLSPVPSSLSLSLCDFFTLLFWPISRRIVSLVCFNRISD